MSRSVPQPPFPSELLADLHGDNLAAELREQLLPQVSADPDALHYLSRLDEVNVHLRALATDERVMHPMPDDVADRMFRFVADLDLEADDDPTDRLSTMAVPPPPPRPPVDAPVSLAQYRSRRRRGWLAAAAASVAVLAGAGAVVTTLDTTDGTPTAAPFTEPASAGDELTTAAALSALGKREVNGPLADEAALARCVQANGVDRTVLGASSITFRGTDAVLVLVIGPKPPTITALVVGAGCTTGAPEQLALRDIG